MEDRDVTSTEHRVPSTVRPFISGLRLVISLALLLGIVLPANAWSAPLDTRYSVLGTSLVVDGQSADPQFPDTIAFALRAHGFEAARAELNYRLVGDPVTAGQQVDVKEPTSQPDLKATLDLSTHYIPPGAEVAYYWTLTDGSGETVDTPAQSFTMLDERHQWQNLSDGQKRVSVHWYEGGQGFGKSLLDTASSALDRLQHDIGAKLERQANVWVYATQDELIDALPKNIPEWVGGKAFPELSLVLAAIGDDANADSEVKRVVPHELSHLVLYGATRNPYNTPPAWLDEGLAVHNQEAHDPVEEETLKAAAEDGSLVPLKALSGSFGASEEEAALGYGESRSAIDFILKDSRYGPEKFARTIAAFRNGVTYDEALQAGLGAAVDQIDQQWRLSLPYRPAARSSPALSLSSPLVLLPVGVCIGLLLAGGILVLVMLIRKRTSTPNI